MIEQTVRSRYDAVSPDGKLSLKAVLLQYIEATQLRDDPSFLKNKLAQIIVQMYAELSVTVLLDVHLGVNVVRLFTSPLCLVINAQLYPRIPKWMAHIFSRHALTG